MQQNTDPTNCSAGTTKANCTVITTARRTGIIASARSRSGMTRAIDQSTAVQQRVDTAERVVGIVNASARQAGAEPATWLEQLLRTRYGIEAEIALAESGEEIASYARLAARDKSELVIAAGGDGTINAVAAHLVGTGKRIGVLPLGTLNHFARDLAIPLELEAAARAMIEGRAISIDV